MVKDGGGGGGKERNKEGSGKNYGENMGKL